MGLPVKANALGRILSRWHLNVLFEVYSSNINDDYFKHSAHIPLYMSAGVEHAVMTLGEEH